MNKMKKTLLVAVAALLLVAVSVGGTLAYLTSKPDAVVNTFTAANIGITLSETVNNSIDADKDGKVDHPWVAQLVPSKKYAKDPVVKVDKEKTTVPIYVYFQVVNEATEYVDYELNTTGWTPVNGQTGVYYRAWNPANDENQADYQWYLLKGEGNDAYKNGLVTIKSGLTADKTSVVEAGKVNLTFKAYAIQQEGFTPESGWTEVSK